MRTALRIGLVGALVFAGALGGYFMTAGAGKAAPSAAVPSQMPTSVTTALDEQGISVSAAPATPNDLPAAQAVRAAVSTYAFLDGEADAAQAFRVRYTDPAYGNITDEATGTVTPFNVDKDAWLVLIPNTTNYIYGPQSYTGPPTYSATLAVFVDASTGDVIEASTIQG